LTIFRLVQEALTNVHRHPAAPPRQVELDRTEAEVTLLIRDQGKGIPESTLNQSDQEANKIGVV